MVPLTQLPHKRLSSRGEEGERKGRREAARKKGEGRKKGREGRGGRRKGNKERDCNDR